MGVLLVFFHIHSYAYSYYSLAFIHSFFHDFLLQFHHETGLSPILSSKDRKYKLVLEETKMSQNHI